MGFATRQQGTRHARPAPYKQGAFRYQHKDPEVLIFSATELIFFFNNLIFFLRSDNVQHDELQR